MQQYRDFRTFLTLHFPPSQHEALARQLLAPGVTGMICVQSPDDSAQATAVTYDTDAPPVVREGAALAYYAKPQLPGPEPV